MVAITKSTMKQNQTQTEEILPSVNVFIFKTLDKGLYMLRTTDLFFQSSKPRSQ